MSDVLLVAHRAGNDLERLAPALAAGADLIEADVHSHRGRLEVRHTKTMGPLPWLWDRWYLIPASDPRLYLHALVEALPAQSHVMLDLKGWHPRLGQRVRAAMAEAAPGTPYTVCSRTWPALAPFGDDDHVRVAHSVRNSVELARLLRLLRTGRRRTWGVSVHADLLTRERVAALREHAEVVLTWPVNTQSELLRVVDLGANAVISDRVDHLDIGRVSRSP